MRETTAAELVETSSDLCVRHHLRPGRDLRAWVAGAAAAVEQPDGAGSGASLWVLGPADEVGPLLDRVSRRRPRPQRVLVDQDAAAALPAAWTPARSRAWHWMWTQDRPAAPGRGVEVLTDHEEVAAFLEHAYPDSFARPGDADVECWLGVRVPGGLGAPGGLVAAGALVRRPDGTGYLRAVSVLAAYRGRGLARDVSAALTRHALTTGSGVATLGVWVDNEPALAIYRGLGFVTAHTFATCALE